MQSDPVGVTSWKHFWNLCGKPKRTVCKAAWNTWYANFSLNVLFTGRFVVTSQIRKFWFVLKCSNFCSALFHFNILLTGRGLRVGHVHTLPRRYIWSLRRSLSGNDVKKQLDVTFGQWRCLLSRKPLWTQSQHNNLFSCSSTMTHLGDVSIGLYWKTPASCEPAIIHVSWWDARWADAHAYNLVATWESASHVDFTCKWQLDKTPDGLKKNT